MAQSLRFEVARQVLSSSPDGAQQIQDREYFQTPHKHFYHSCGREKGRDGGVIGHRAHISETGTDIADEGDRCCDPRGEVQSESDVYCGEDEHEDQIAYDVAECVAYLARRPDTAIYSDDLDRVRFNSQGDFPYGAFGRQDGPVYLDASGS